MKTNSKTFLFFSLIFILIGFFGCDNKSGQIEQLSSENDALQEKYQEQLIETRIATHNADSLQTSLNSLQREIQKMKGDLPEYQASTEDEKSIELLVNNLQRGWTEMVDSDDTDKLLKYFLPQYTTSAIRVNTENIPSVQRKNNANFEEHLNELMLANDISLSFGQTKFLYTEVKGDIFVSSYRTQLRVYYNNEEAYTSSLITLLAGQRKDGEWKVGNYSWVNFNY